MRSVWPFDLEENDGVWTIRLSMGDYSYFIEQAPSFDKALKKAKRLKRGLQRQLSFLDGLSQGMHDRPLFEGWQLASNEVIGRYRKWRESI